MRAHLAPGVAGDDGVAGVQRAALDEHRGDRAAADVEPGLDDRSRTPRRRGWPSARARRTAAAASRAASRGPPSASRRRRRRSVSPPHSSGCRPCATSSCRTCSGFASGRSILLTATTIGTPAAFAWSIASMVCGMTPSSAATTSTATSVTFAPRARRAVNASWPGVSRNVTLRSPIVDLVGADVLGDAAGLAGRHRGLADGVEQRRLAVVDVAHDRDDRGARLRGPRRRPPAMSSTSSSARLIVISRSSSPPISSTASSVSDCVIVTISPRPNIILMISAADTLSFVGELLDGDAGRDRDRARSGRGWAILALALAARDRGRAAAARAGRGRPASRSRRGGACRPGRRAADAHGCRRHRARARRRRADRRVRAGGECRDGRPGGRGRRGAGRRGRGRPGAARRGRAVGPRAAGGVGPRRRRAAWSGAVGGPRRRPGGRPGDAAEAAAAPSPADARAARAAPAAACARWRCRARAWPSASRRPWRPRRRARSCQGACGGGLVDQISANGDARLVETCGDLVRIESALARDIGDAALGHQR